VKNRNLILIVGVVAPYVLIYWHKLLIFGLVPFGRDVPFFSLSAWVIGKKLFRDGFFLLWDTYRNMGQPFLASPQVKVFSRIGAGSLIIANLSGNNLKSLTLQLFLGRRQVVRHGTLDPAFEGSNPSAPENFSNS
jgi:hypothetical protein